MNAPASSTAQRDMTTLREGIRATYRTYQQADPFRFPDFDFNTNRVNYEPLRASFEEEFFVVRGLDRQTPTIGIPSTNTLALLFTDAHYVPGRKILNTCYSYAEGPTRKIVPLAATAPAAPSVRRSKRAKWLLIGGVVGAVVACLLIVGGRWLFRPMPSGLVISRPAHRSIVPQEVVVEGRVKNAETVWLVVRAPKGSLYYVQPPAIVQWDGGWISVIYVGMVGYDHGITYQVRAFVNPAKELKSGMILQDWPDAETASGVIEVVRRPVSN